MSAQMQNCVETKFWSDLNRPGSDGKELAWDDSSMLKKGRTEVNIHT